MKRILFLLTVSALAVQALFPQVPGKIAIDVLRAEDERRFDKVISELFSASDPAVRERAALAAGRIGDEKAVPGLAAMLADKSLKTAETAAFALGEIESLQASDALLAVLGKPSSPTGLRARAVEAAGKIAAANSKDPKAKELGEAILNALDTEDSKGESQSRDVILLGLTAALRARPVDADYEIEKFFTNIDAQVRADALNAYARLRAKTAVKKIVSILLVDEDPVVRANAARALGAAEDKVALNPLLNASETDDDIRVRVSALRSLGSLAEPATADRLMMRLGSIVELYKKSPYAHPVEQNELLETAAALARVAEGTASTRVLELLKSLSKATRYETPEIESAIASVDPKGYWDYLNRTVLAKERDTWRGMASAAAALSSIVEFLNKEENSALKLKITDHFKRAVPRHGSLPDDVAKVVPAYVQVLANLKPTEIDDILRTYLKNRDVFVRAAAALELADRPPTKENVDALVEAFGESLKTDNDYDDAQLAILSAVVKLDKVRAKGPLESALKHHDYLIRQLAFRLIRDNDLLAEFKSARAMATGLRKYDPKTGSKLGQVLYGDGDYIRALSRKNGKTAAIVSTEKGKFTIQLFPEEAPLTVDNFVSLAEKGYFNGIDIHRVVANFVVQDGDPRGDGNGGPGWQIRCEINTIPYERGMVGMALSGKDTGGSQWFITHSPQPHLDGGYSVFGRVNEEGMKVVDGLVRGDRIVKIEIVGTK